MSARIAKIGGRPLIDHAPSEDEPFCFRSAGTRKRAAIVFDMKRLVPRITLVEKHLSLASLGARGVLAVPMATLQFSCGGAVAAGRGRNYAKGLTKSKPRRQVPAPSPLSYRMSIDARPLLLPLILAAVTLLAATASVEATGAYETQEFVDVVSVTQQYVARHGADKVLLVCDIDNTLLAMDNALGSDQWFEWQNYLLDHEPDSPRLVAKSFDELLAAQGVLFALGKMHPPETDLPTHIKTIQDTGVSTLVLTSRGPKFRVPTLRELNANGYDFAKSALPLVDVPGGVYAPYDLQAVQNAGLTDEEAKRFRLKKPRGVSYSHGVMMTSGQHKGAMLLTMLARSPKEYKAVVFVDDHGRHVLRVYDALVAREIDIVTFHYKREDDNVNRFEYSDKQEVARQWRRLDKTLDAVFE